MIVIIFKKTIIRKYIMNILRSIRLIINYKTFIVTILAIIATYGCDKYAYIADMPLTLIGIAIVFPIVFAINSAYVRRESALQNLADFKAHSIALAYAARDWEGDESFDGLPDELKTRLFNVYSVIREKLLTRADHKKNILSDYEKTISEEFTNLSKTIQKFRELGLPSGEVSRVNQYLSKILVDYRSRDVNILRVSSHTLRKPEEYL